MNDDLRDAIMHEFNTDDDDNEKLSFEEEAFLDSIAIGKSHFPEDVHDWKMNDFREYFEFCKDLIEDGTEEENENFAWIFLYEKIRERAGEGKGGVEFAEEEFENSKRKWKENFESDDEYDDDEEDE